MRKRLAEIALRKAEIRGLLDNATVEELAGFETELDSLESEERNLNSKLNLRGRLENENVEVPAERNETQQSEVEQRAEALRRDNRMSINTRSLLVSGGTIAMPTTVSEINDSYGVQVSSIVDMVTVEDCTGTGTNRVPYAIGGMDAAVGTEGSAATSDDLEFDYVDLEPKDFNVVSYISKQIQKRSPGAYEDKVRKAVRDALRKKISARIIASIYASDIVQTISVASKTIDATTLRKITMNFGGDEGIGAGTLILHKDDLIAFGDVRGTNEKKGVYEITADPSNPNIGTIKDGGLTVKYILNKNCQPLTSATDEDLTMLFGDLKAIELDTWGEIEIEVSRDYKFSEGLLSIRGETLVDAALVQYHGFSVVQYEAPSVS